MDFVSWCEFYVLSATWILLILTLFYIKLKSQHFICLISCISSGLCVSVCPNMWSSKFHQAIGAFAISCIKYIHFNWSRFDCMCTIWPSKLNADVGRMHELTKNTDKTREKYNGESNYLNSSTFSKHMNSSAKKIKIFGHFYLKHWK